MYDQDTHEKFMELRAQGWTLGHIASELHVSKRTLVEWGQAFAADIQKLRASELELLKERIITSREEEISRLARLRKDVNDELSNRALRTIPIEKLFQLSIGLREEIERAGLEKDSPEATSRSAINGYPTPATNGTPRH